MRFGQIVGSFLRYGRLFSMRSWSAYVDESYNKQVFCVGGWVAPVGLWTKLESAWSERIAYENRISAKHGFPAISRYHATDCANLKREFSESKGWSVERQIRLSKKLCGIVASHAPVGIVQGGLVDGMIRHWPRDNTEDFRKDLYYISFGMYLVALGEKMALGYQSDRVTVFYDRGKELGAIAQMTFKRFKEDPATADLAQYFVTCAPMDWQMCVPLQPADLLAYEGLKRIQQKVSGINGIRKSLQAILGERTQIEFGWATEPNFAEMRRLADQRRKNLQS